MNSTENFTYPPIFLSSSDNYSDIWDLFFFFFKKYWPEYNGTIYLNTQFKEISFNGLNIVCTKLGRLGSFGKEMRACLDMMQAETVMLMLIDFIFMNKVNDQKIKEYLIFFKKHNLDTLNFQYYKSVNQLDSENPDIVFVKPPAPHKYFNYQIAIWKKASLYQMVLPHENPWTSEWFGTQRAEKMNLRQALVKESSGSPICYDQSGCLSKSKWHPVAVDFLRKENIPIDFSKRGFATLNDPKTLKKIFKTKKMLVLDGVRGSYLDLLFRKEINI